MTSCNLSGCVKGDTVRRCRHCVCFRCCDSLNVKVYRTPWSRPRTVQPNIKLSKTAPVRVSPENSNQLFFTCKSGRSHKERVCYVDGMQPKLFVI